MEAKDAFLLNGELCYIDQHSSPRKVLYPDGILVLQDGTPLEFQNLIPDGEVHTPRFGWIRKYKREIKDQ